MKDIKFKETSCQRPLGGNCFEGKASSSWGTSIPERAARVTSLRPGDHNQAPRVVQHGYRQWSRKRAEGYVEGRQGNILQSPEGQGQLLKKSLGTACCYKLNKNQIPESTSKVTDNLL